jgi:hypothetical protein
MKTAVIICSLGAAAAAMFSMKLGWPDEAQQRYYRAHNEVEQIAFRKDGTEELQKAVTHERAAEKDLFVTRDLGRRVLWVSVGFSGAAFAMALLTLKRKEPIQPPQTTTGNSAPGRV